MSFLAVVLVITAAFTHAAWNLIQKRAAHVGIAFIFATALFSSALYLPWVTWVLIESETRWTGEILLCIGASAVIHLAYSLSLQRGYQLSDLSVVYPVARGTGPVISSLGAVLVLHEPVSPFGLVGLCAVVGGIVLIATDGSFRRFATPAAASGVRWGLLTGALIAAYTVVDAYGVKVLGVHPVIFDWFTSTARLLFLVPVAAPQIARARTAMRGWWWPALAVGALSPLGYILVLMALRMGAPLSFVAPAREMSMMIGALLGMLVLRERVGLWRLAGCAALVVGVVLLGLR